MANATTSGGLMRKLAFTAWWMRASKLRFPDSTAAQTRSFVVIASSMRASSGPEFPMHVVQPYPTTSNPSFSSAGSRPVRWR